MKPIEEALAFIGTIVVVYYALTVISTTATWLAEWRSKKKASKRR